MKKQQILETYNKEYAASYNERFFMNECRSRFDREIQIVSQLLVHGGPWLDVGCGTGYLLSRFPGVPRAGIDLSPAMLDQATRANPDALFLREGDFLQDIPEWQGQWALVSCTWYTYCLVESMAEVERVVRNLAQWTSETGACFVPLCDPALISPGVHVPYCTEQQFYGGKIFIAGVIWTWIDNAGKEHQNMIAPQIQHMVAMFQNHFESVELIEYPLSDLGPSPTRKAIIARAKKRL